MKDVEGTCDVCGEYNTFSANEDTQIGDGLNTYCSNCGEQTEHTIVEIVDKLKLCPCCGGEAHFEQDDEGWEWIECGSCHLATNRSISLMEDCKPKLAESWNRRVTP